MRKEKIDKLELMFSQLPDGMIIINAVQPHSILNINPAACRILSLERQTTMGKKIASLFKKKYPGLLQLVDETIKRQRAIKNFAIEIKPNRGEPKTLLVTTTFPTKVKAGDNIITLMLHDISETTQLRRHSQIGQKFEALIGSAPPMKRVFSLIDQIAAFDTAALIYGETGTGKELVARAIHERSPRSKAPFIPVHCSALASNLLESDLFGHVKGAFTGAVRDRPGRFEMAEGGTIFLDEVATLTPEIQVKLLRVLQEKTIERVGGTRTNSVDVRIISATNRRLPELIKKGSFRQDLYYRIKVVQLELPPLRERWGDIPILAEYFIDKFNRQHNQRILNISKEARNLLLKYPWPGNVRELENAIEHAIVISQGSTIDPHCLPQEIRTHQTGNQFPIMEVSKDGITEETIRQTLNKTAGNVTRAAKFLGIHRTTLWRKMKEFGVSRLLDDHSTNASPRSPTKPAA